MAVVVAVVITLVEEVGSMWKMVMATVSVSSAAG
jgi:hypothetical protein